jgi:hypothetical protein
MILALENEVLGQKPLQCYFVYQKSYTQWRRYNRGVCYERSTTTSTKHGTASSIFLLVYYYEY